MTKIGVLGLGLIGGSIFKKLRSLNYDVIGISASQNGENIFTDINLLKNCDIVFVCTAMNKCLETLDKLENILPSTAAETVLNSRRLRTNFLGSFLAVYGDAISFISTLDSCLVQDLSSLLERCCRDKA